MSAHAPDTFFRFAADHIALLRELFYRTDGISESELRGLILRLRKPDHPSSGYLFKQLIELNLIEEMPGQTALLELTPPWKMILGHLFREQRLTATAVIQTYLSELQRIDADLTSAMESGNDARASILLDELRSQIERLRHDSRDNRLGVIVETVRFKSGDSAVPAPVRYERILYFWERFIEPLRDIIDSRKEMDERLRSLERLMKTGEKRYRIDPVMHREFSSLASRLIRLLRDTMEDYRESVRELQPLYQEALRNSRYLRGASLALDRVSRHGLRQLGLNEMLALPSARANAPQNLISDDYAEGYLHGVRNAPPASHAPIGVCAAPSLPPVLPYDRVRAELRSMLPVDDALDAIRSLHPEPDLHRALSLFGRLYGDPFFIRRFSGRREYRFDSVTVCAYRLGLEQVDESPSM